MSSIYSVVWNSIPDEEKPNIALATATLNDASENPKQPIAVDYTKQAMRYAYYYRHFTSTVYCVSHCWSKFLFQSTAVDLLFKDLLNQGEVKILSLGGSGSDIVGFSHWIKSRDLRLRIASVVVDKYDWSVESKKILSRFPICTLRGSENVYYCPFDFVNTKLDDSLKLQIQKADVFSIVKFLSTVPCDTTKIQAKLTEVFKLLHEAALVMYVDVIDSDYTVVINGAAQNAGLRSMGHLSDVTINVQSHEAAEMKANCLWQLKPVQEERLTASLWQK